MTPSERADLAARLWQGLPFLWQVELELFEAHENHVGQEITPEGLTLWFTRVQARQCPIAGEGCPPPRASRFCEHHRKVALPGQ